MMAQVLKVPYLDTTCFAVFTVGKQKYTVHAQHGSSGARLPYTKIKAVLDLWRFNEAELVLMGHLHSLDHATQLYQRVDKRTGQLVEATRHACICGSYLRYRGSYAESLSLPPVQIGSPLVYLYGDEHKIHVNI